MSEKTRRLDTVQPHARYSDTDRRKSDLNSRALQRKTWSTLAEPRDVSPDLYAARDHVTWIITIIIKVLNNDLGNIGQLLYCVTRVHK